VKKELLRLEKDQGAFYLYRKYQSNSSGKIIKYKDIYMGEDGKWNIPL
jgi:hypothetical protein